MADNKSLPIRPEEMLGDKFFAVGFLASIVGWLSLLGTVSAQDGPITLFDLQTRIDAQQAEIQTLQRRIDVAEAPLGMLPDSSDDGCTPGMIEQFTLIAEKPFDANCDDSEKSAAFHSLKYYVDYENGFVVRPFDQEKHPFDLKFNGWTQFRHHGFVSRTDSWTDNAGVTRPKDDRNAFDIEAHD